MKRKKFIIMKTKTGLMTDTFESAWDELNTINEAWKSKAAKSVSEREEAASVFYGTVKNKLAIDFDSFHKAFDADLKLYKGVSCKLRINVKAKYQWLENS